MKLTVFPFCVAALSLSQVGAQPASPAPQANAAQGGVSETRLRALDSFTRSLVEGGGYLGAVTLIARHGQIVNWRAQGYRDLARSSPLHGDSIFRINSMTKTVASVAVLMLMEDGKLVLDDPIEKHLPEFAGIKVFAGGSADAPQLRVPKRPISIRHLLTHTGGFATSGKNTEAVKLFNRFDLHQSATLKDYVAYVAHQPLALDPGERFNYDGVSTEILSHLVEVLSGQPFDQFLQQRILKPLAMKDTGFHVPMAQRHRIADMVTTDAQGHLRIAATKDAQQPGAMLNPYPSGAGGLYSTAGDYLRFCQMLLNGGSLDGVSVLSRKTVDLMMMNHLGSAEVPSGALREGEGFGLGGYVVLDVAKRGRLGSVGQFGWSGAGSTYYTIDRQEGLVALLLMQHLPQGLPKDPPKVSPQFFNLLYQSLVN
jgi:CubicO group peptidase (beta-lactamase class C family)